MTDLILLLGIGIALGVGVWGAIVNRTTYSKMGSVLAAIAMCDGLAYFGWKPYFGGTHDPGTYFGCVMLTFGTVGWLLFRSGTAGWGTTPSQDDKK